MLQMVRACVEASSTHNTFYSIWSEAKDRLSELTYPCAIWDQWPSSRLVEDRDTGLLHRVQLVRLLLVTDVSTERTAAQRDDAVNAADAAAVEIVGLLRGTYGNEVEVSNVLITTQYDEGTVLETGVLLQFQLKSVQGICDLVIPS